MVACTVGSFRNRLALLNEGSKEFLRLLVALGGYCTASQAKDLKIGASGTRVRARLRALERLRFLRRVTAYPVVYQITKSTTRMLGRDSSNRRRHTLATVQARLLALSFYLEARSWPSEFIFNHAEKIATFIEAGCPLSILPQRVGKLHLWEHFLLWLPDGRIGVAIVDQPHPGAFSQLRLFIRKFLPALRYMREELVLLIVTGDKRRCQLYERLLRRHPAIRKLGLGEFGNTIEPYRVQQPIPSITELMWPSAKKHEVFRLPTNGSSQANHRSPGAESPSANAERGSKEETPAIQSLLGR
jgi:hypothetical protein